MAIAFLPPEFTPETHLASFLPSLLFILDLSLRQSLDAHNRPLHLPLPQAGAPPRHQQAIIKADYHDTIRTLVFTGRPLRVLKNEYVLDWEFNRQKEMKELLEKGILPYKADVDKYQQE